MKTWSGSGGGRELFQYNCWLIQSRAYWAAAVRCVAGASPAPGPRHNENRFEMTRLTLSLIWALAALIASAAPGMAVAQDEELLEPEKAFAVRAEAAGAGRVAVTWDIAEGYYMYRDKFGFAVAGGGGEVSAVSYPDGRIKSDEFFGDVEVYVDRAVFDVALAGAGDEVTLLLDGQGCNEPVGVCYPPMT